MWDSSFRETTLGLRCLTDSFKVKVNSVRARRVLSDLVLFSGNG